MFIRILKVVFTYIQYVAMNMILGLFALIPIILYCKGIIVIAGVIIGLLSCILAGIMYYKNIKDGYSEGLSK